MLVLQFWLDALLSFLSNLENDSYGQRFVFCFNFFFKITNSILTKFYAWNVIYSNKWPFPDSNSLLPRISGFVFVLFTQLLSSILFISEKQNLTRKYIVSFSQLFNIFFYFYSCKKKKNSEDLISSSFQVKNISWKEW